MDRMPHGLRVALTAVAALSLAVVCPARAASLTEPSALASGTSARAPDFAQVEVGLVTAMTGFVDPIFLTHAGDGSRRLFIVEQRGVVTISKRGQVLPIPFLDLQSRVLSGGERGLLGLAFHPEHVRNRKFYLFFTEPGSGDLIIAEMRASVRNRDRALLGSFRRLLRVPHRRHANHNGGMLAFGEDGLLYIATGDGGGGGDPDNHAQSRTSRLGKLLRIDVDGRSGGLAYRIPPTNPHATSTTFKREIWSRGLRNPFRFSFDRRGGDLWIGDVGQNRFEEVDRATQASGGGRAVNFGWRLLEGRACFQPPSDCNRAGKQAPLTVYDHSEGCAVIGGYVYRGPIEILRGAYLFSDVCSGEIWSVVAEGAARQRKVLMAETDLPISSFGESETGALFVTALDGNVYRLTATRR
ncbi:PQQ-dependent sugar dehydrogenase [soil metagenome]